MSPLTVFLAKLLGLYCIISALAIMTRKESAIATIEQFVSNPALLLRVEVIGLAGGLAMIIGYNVWTGGALPIVITLIGWLMAIRGAVLLALPQDATIKFFEYALHGTLLLVHGWHIGSGPLPRADSAQV